MHSTDPSPVLQLGGCPVRWAPSGASLSRRGRTLRIRAGQTPEIATEKETWADTVVPGTHLFDFPVPLDDEYQPDTRAGGGPRMTKGENTRSHRAQRAWRLTAAERWGDPALSSAQWDEALISLREVFRCLELEGNVRC